MVINLRLKHVKGASEIIEKSKYIVSEPTNYKGKIDKLFNNKNKIYIEIGMGKGDFIIENAKRYPDINFIGIERFDSIIVRAIEKLEKEEINNLKLYKIDADEIESIFDKEIDKIYLNFSDPWPKVRHEKRRLSSENFLKKYDKIFKSKKQITMKTDNRHLFEFSLMSYTNYGYKIKDISLDLYKDEYKENIPTEYETKFHSKGFPIYYIDTEK
jgi:tRNA (guanine-N(7)-)-methyltransferase